MRPLGDLLGGEMLALGGDFPSTVHSTATRDPAAARPELCQPPPPLRGEAARPPPCRGREAGPRRVRAISFDPATCPAPAVAFAAVSGAAAAAAASGTRRGACRPAERECEGACRAALERPPASALVARTRAHARTHARTHTRTHATAGARRTLTAPRGVRCRHKPPDPAHGNARPSHSHHPRARTRCRRPSMAARQTAQGGGTGGHHQHGKITTQPSDLQILPIPTVLLEARSTARRRLAEMG